MTVALCDNCAYFAFEDVYDIYFCDVQLVGHDLARFMTGNTDNCHYFQLYDEYKIVEKQN